MTETSGNPGEVDWRDWSKWQEMYDHWVEFFEEVNLKLDSLRRLYEWLLSEIERRGSTRYWEGLNIALLLDPSLTYADAEKILSSVMEHPLTEEEEIEIHSITLESKLKVLKKRAKHLKEIDDELKRKA